MEAEAGESYTIQPATQAEAKSIHKLIHSVGINPMDLDWRRFLIAADGQGRVLGCGQVKPHGDGTRELASIAVWPEYRRRGIARALIQRLLAENPPPLYLTCLAPMQPFYEPFGFRVLAPDEMSPYFRRIHRVFAIFQKLNPRTERLLVMFKKDEQQVPG